MKQRFKQRLKRLVPVLLSLAVIAAFSPQICNQASAYDSNNPRIEVDKDGVQYIVVYVTYKVIGGAWSGGGSDDVVIRLSRRVDQDLALVITGGIPYAGGDPFYGYKASGTWEQDPQDDFDPYKLGDDRAFDYDVTYTFTYERDESVKFPSVTFKVENGKWDDGTTAPKTVKLTHANLDGATLAASEIPAVGSKPDKGYEAGSWDVKPDTKTGWKQHTTFTYTYVKEKPKIPLLSRLKARGSKSLALSWSKVKGAKGYDIFFSKCADKSLKKVKTVKGNKTFKWTKKGLKKQTAYRAIVKAYTIKGGKKKYIKTSPMMHAFTSGGNANYTNPKSVTVNKTSVSLKVGKKYKIKAKVSKLKKTKKLISKYHCPKLRYLSSDKKVAEVSNKGVITAKDIGSCKVYAIAADGTSKAVIVKVK